MSKTFLSFRVKHVIRSCAFVLAMILVMNGETSRAAVPRFSRNFIDTTICASIGTSIPLDALLEFTDADATGADTFTLFRGPVIINGIGVAGSVGFTGPVFVSSPGGTTNYTGATYNFNSGHYGVRSFTMRVSDGADWDTVQIRVHLVRPPLPTITGDYTTVHRNGTAIFNGGETNGPIITGALSGTWSITGANATVVGSTLTATVTGVNIGTDVIEYHLTNACATVSTTSPITIITDIPPTVTPVAGDARIPGTTYTINGSGFNATATNNIVYFGAAKATVLSGSTTTLQVTVPTGATHAPIFVVDNVTHLSSFTMPSFTPLYDTTGFIGSSLKSVYASGLQTPTLNLPGGGLGGAYSVEFADFDGDGNSDIVACGTGTASVSVYRNTPSMFHTVDASSFSGPVQFTVGASPISVKVADLDGDGKLDVVTANAGASTVSILRNTSTVGSISFAPKFDIRLPGLLTSEIAIADLDNDGRPDIAAAMLGARLGEAELVFTPTTEEKRGRFVVARNKFNRGPSVTMSVNSFDTLTVFTYDTASAPISIAVGKLNNDTKADVVIANHHGRVVNVFTNTSSAAGTIAFSGPASFSTGSGSGTSAAKPSNGYVGLTGYPNQVRLSDLDNDGLSDIAVAVTDSDLLQTNVYNMVDVFRNTSSGGTITFGSHLSFPTRNASPVALTIADLSGDKRPDIVVSNAGKGTISLIEHAHAAGSLSGSSYLTADTVALPGAGVGPVCPAVSDIDGNSIYDIAVAARGSNRLYLLRGYPRPDTTSITGDTVLCISATTTLFSAHATTTPATTGTWSVSSPAHCTLNTTASDTSIRVTGNSAGVDTIYYTVVHLFDTNVVKHVIRIRSAVAAGPITVVGGGDSVCVGSNISLTSSPAGGAWSSSAPTVASIDASTGVVHGLIGGSSTTISYGIAGCGTPSTAVIRVIAPPTAGTISGRDTMCSFDTLHISTGTHGGVWRSKNNVVTFTMSATHDSVFLVRPTTTTTGVDTMIYTVTTACGADSSKFGFFVAADLFDGAISGTASVCVGNDVTLSTTSTAGGTWSSSNNAIATVTNTGVVHGVSGGSVSIIYTVTSPCGTVTDVYPFTVSAAVGTVTVTGPTRVCSGTTIALTGSPAGGTFSSSAPGVSSVNPTSGVVTGGPAAGQDTIFYAVTAACGTVTAFILDTVIAQPNAGTITGPSTTLTDSVCVGSTITFNNTTASPSGTWSSAASTIAAVGATTGVVTGVNGGTTNIIYTVTNFCGTATATRPVRVKALAEAGTGISPSSVSICSGNGIALSAPGGDAGGTWRSDDATTASVDPVTGFVTGTATTAIGANPAHTTTIWYVVRNADCNSSDSVSVFVTVTTAPNLSAITTTGAFPAGRDSMCVGTTMSQTATPLGGTWVSSTPSIATITSAGVVGAAAAGRDTISYRLTNFCGTDTARRVIKVIGLPSAGSIVAPSVVCYPGPDVQLYDTLANGDTISSGTWTTPTGTSLFVNTFTGLATPQSGGFTTVQYNVTGFCGTATTTRSIFVTNGADAGVTSGDTAMCVGGTITLTNTNYPFGDYWSSSDTSIARVDAFGVVTGVAAGDATIYYVDTNACGASLAPHIVHVGGLSPVGVIYGQDTSCIGGTAQLYDTLAPGGVWSVTGGVATIDASGLVTAVSAGTATISYTTSNGCGPNSATYTFRVFAAPNFTSATTRNVCDSQLLSYVPTSDSAGVSYTWTRATTIGVSNIAGAGIDSVHEYLDNVVDSVVHVSYVFTTSLHGCTANSTMVAAVSPTPRLISPLFDTICGGSVFTYVPVSSAGTSTVFAWVRPLAPGIGNTTPGAGTGSISEILTNSTTPPTGATAVYIYTINYPGCPTHTENVTVAVNPSPGYPQITTHSPSNVCTNTLDQNFGSATPPPAGITYTWSATGAQVWATGSTRQYSLVNFTTPGDAVVYLLATISGFDCPVKDSFPVNVSSSVSDLPEVIYFNGDFVCLANDQDTYQWGYDDRATLDSALFDGQTNQNYTVATPDFTGKYYFVITTHNGCMQKSYFNPPTGIKNVTGTMGEMKIFPNPADNFVNVEINNTAGGKYNVEVVNLLGQKLDGRDLINNKTTLNVADLAGGVYFINCYRDGVKFASAKFVKN